MPFAELKVAKNVLGRGSNCRCWIALVRAPSLMKSLMMAKVSGDVGDEAATGIILGWWLKMRERNIGQGS